MIAPKYWPTTGWQATLPENQGMDSKILDEAYHYLITNFPALRQITIIRHGYMVFHRENLAAHESSASVIFRKSLAGWVSLFGCPPETFTHNYKNVWNTRSATKSVTSILLGKVIADGLIDGLDQPLAEILPEYFGDVDEPKKRRITIRHLLTMTSGLRSVEGGITSIKMLSSSNWARFMARLPLEHNPGEHFTYNSANPHLISAIISKVSGKSLFDYGKEHLFLPLGIREVIWGAGPEGISFGGGNLFLSSQELAKIGLLVLHQGRWEDQQLIPSTWIAKSLQPYQEFFPGWEYGYYWYLHAEDDAKRHKQWLTFSAAGTGGQKLLIVPELNLILAAVAKTDFIGERGIYLNHAIGKYLLPAIQD